MGYKVPIYVSGLDDESRDVWNSDLFGRWSNTDLITALEIPITDWNMQADEIKNIVIPFVVKIVRNAAAMIFDDLGLSSKVGSNELGIDIEIKQNPVTLKTEVIMTRKNGGIFDSAEYSGTAERGFLTIWKSA